MKSLIFKFGALIIGLAGIFLAGSRMGRKEEQNKQLKEEHNDTLDNIKITKKVNSMSFSDKSSFLRSKQRKDTK